MRAIACAGMLVFCSFMSSGQPDEQGTATSVLTKIKKMKNIKSIPPCLFLAVAMVFFALFACKQSNTASETGHQEAVELTETMRLSHKGMEERLDFLKTVNKEFKQQVKALDSPNDSLKNIVALQDSLINQFEGMCKQQKRLIDENEDYIKKHERRSLDADKIADQHHEIRKNYEQLQLQAAAIVQEVENIKIRIDGATLGENKTQ